MQLAAAHPVQPDLGPGVLQLDGELGHQGGECPEYLVQPVTQPSLVLTRMATSRRICWLTAGCTMVSRSAARPKCSSSATVTK
jgi:hypothetical protein